MQSPGFPKIVYCDGLASGFGCRSDGLDQMVSVRVPWDSDGVACEGIVLGFGLSE